MIAKNISTPTAIAIMVAVSGIFLLYLFGFELKKEIPQFSFKKMAMKGNSIKLPKPTGKLDDTVSSVVADLAADENLTADEEKNAAAVIEEGTDVTEIGQSFDEDEL